MDNAEPKAMFGTRHKMQTNKANDTTQPNTKQSFKGKGKTHKSTNRQNQLTTGKLGKSQRLGIYVVVFIVLLL
jgi:hypothetical protein